MKFPKQATDETGTTSRVEAQSEEQSIQQRSLVTSLRRGTERRDAEIEALTQAVDCEQRVAEALRKTVGKSQQRINELEQGIEERMAKCRELRDALKIERERADAAEEELRGRDNPQAAAKNPRKHEKMPTLEALMDDDSYMRETLVLDDDAEEQMAASTTTLPKTVPELDSELVPAELIFPAGEEPTNEADNPGNQETMGDAGESVDLQLAPSESEGGKVDRRKSTFKRTLAIVLDEGTPIRHPIYKASLTIGRSREADIQIASDFISRVHALITTDKEGTYVEDASSKNGVRVNDVRTEGKQPIAHGDSVRLGRVEFKIVDLSLDDAS
jgi:hypothetical protein